MDGLQGMRAVPILFPSDARAQGTCTVYKLLFS